MAISNPIRPDGHFADLSDQGHRDALEHRNPGGRPPEKCDKASAFLTEKLTQRDCKAWGADGAIHRLADGAIHRLAKRTVPSALWYLENVNDP